MAIERRARERIAALRAEAEAVAERRRAEVLRRSEGELRGRIAQDLARARLDARQHLLEARAGLLDRVFARGRELLADAMRSPAARRAIAARVRDGLDFVPPGGALILCSPDVGPVLQDELAELLDGAETGLRIETRPDLPPGFRIIATGGALTIDATLERLLELDRPILAIEVLRRLDAEAV